MPLTIIAGLDFSNKLTICWSCFSRRILPFSTFKQDWSTPILKLAMVKRLEVKKIIKNFVKKFAKKFVKNFVKKIRKIIVKNICIKKLSKRSLKSVFMNMNWNAKMNYFSISSNWDFLTFDVINNDPFLTL